MENLCRPPPPPISSWQGALQIVVILYMWTTLTYSATLECRQVGVLESHICFFGLAHRHKRLADEVDDHHRLKERLAEN